MTEDEAISILNRQFVSDEGFLAKLRAQGTLGEDGVAQVRLALAALTQQWAASVSVPKRAVFALAHWNLLDALIEIFPDLPLNRLHSDLFGLIELCLTPGEWATAEWRIGYDGPERTLVDEFRSEDGFLMRLHGGYGVEQQSVERILGAIQSVRMQYRGHARIPKAVAYVLVFAPEVIRGRWGIYRDRPSVQQEVLALADEIGQRVRSCLQDEQDRTFGQNKT